MVKSLPGVTPKPRFGPILDSTVYPSSVSFLVVCIAVARKEKKTTESRLSISRLVPSMLGGWVDPHREQQTIPQGQTSIPPKSFSTPTANGQSAPCSGSARGVGRGAGSHTPSTASESFSGYHISHSHSGIDEKRPTEKFLK